MFPSIRPSVFWCVRPLFTYKKKISCAFTYLLLIAFVYLLCSGIWWPLLFRESIILIFNSKLYCNIEKNAPGTDYLLIFVFVLCWPRSCIFFFFHYLYCFLFCYYKPFIPSRSHLYQRYWYRCLGNGLCNIFFLRLFWLDMSVFLCNPSGMNETQSYFLLYKGWLLYPIRWVMHSRPTAIFSFTASLQPTSSLTHSVLKFVHPSMSPKRRTVLI